MVKSLKNCNLAHPNDFFALKETNFCILYFRIFKRSDKRPTSQYQDCKHCSTGQLILISVLKFMLFLVVLNVNQHRSNECCLSLSTCTYFPMQAGTAEASRNLRWQAQKILE